MSGDADRRRDQPIGFLRWPDPVEQLADGDWVVRPVSGAATTKTYRCPGCDQHIALGTPHVVAWPLGSVEDRRHWHTPCWRRRRGRR